MGKRTKLKREKIEAKSKAINEVLTSDKRPSRKPSKRMTLGEVSYGLYIHEDLKDKIIRLERDWKSKSYNKTKQQISYIRHLFVKYPVPSFLYESFLQLGPYNITCTTDNDRYTFQKWLVTLGTGAKYHKVVKDYMTKKEANLFLKAPSKNTININIWWVRAMGIGVKKDIFDCLSERFFYLVNFKNEDSRYVDILRFFAKYQDHMNRQTIEEIIDFLRIKLVTDEDFVIKGRTIQSMVEKSNQWHLETQRAKAHTLIGWDPLPIKDWEFKGKISNWRIFQLTTNKQLIYEGRKMRHCVSSYVHNCQHGRSYIFSMEKTAKDPDDGTKTKMATIEVNPEREIRQVRGKMNTMASPDIKFVLRHWAGDNGLRM